MPNRVFIAFSFQDSASSAVKSGPRGGLVAVKEAAAGVHRLAGLVEPEATLAVGVKKRTPTLGAEGGVHVVEFLLVLGEAGVLLPEGLLNGPLEPAGGAGQVDAEEVLVGHVLGGVAGVVAPAGQFDTDLDQLLAGTIPFSHWPSPLQSVPTVAGGVLANVCSERLVSAEGGIHQIGAVKLTAVALPSMALVLVQNVAIGGRYDVEVKHH